MLFEDIRSMLKHPLHKFEGGCNFATADFICDIISGISATLFKPDKGLNKERFRELTQKYYPWTRKKSIRNRGAL